MSQAPVWRQQEIMLQRVAVALGPELLAQMAFVGGCTTALMLTDSVSREAVRFTDDVDLIVHVLGATDWYALQSTLQARGFLVSPDDDVICRMRLAAGGERPLIVDFMPDDESILGFSNRWYADALRTAQPHALPGGTVIRLVTPVYFVATKLEAYRGRGNNDPLGSRDIEDLLTVLDGREALRAELAAADPGLQQVVAEQLAVLMAHPDFEYAVQSAVRGNAQREALLFRRLEAMAVLAG